MKTDETKLIKATIHLRRRPDHHPIPAYEDYLGCPPRERLSVKEFGKRYGAHPDELEQVSVHCWSIGLTVLSSHTARRHVCVEGTVAQFNKGFGVTLHDHEKRGQKYRLPDQSPTLPDHLKDVILHVGLGMPPMERLTFTDIPSSPGSPGDGTIATITPATYATLMGWPTNGTGQTIGVMVFADPLSYSLSDIESTCSEWGIANPTLVDISVDGSPFATNNGNAEWNQDILCSHAFAVGATIAVYFVEGDVLSAYGRMIHPNDGDPICDVTTASGTYYDEVTPFVTDPYIGEVAHLLFEDAALQGITIVSATGDIGSGASVGDGKDHACGNVDPYMLTVGGTVPGNISGETFVEWLASYGQVGLANYLIGGGGGVSIYVPLPSYQANSNVPPSTNSGTVGRGIPDVSTTFFGTFSIYLNGVNGPTAGGTSQSAPITAGLIALINKAIGRNCGFINPTLYSNASYVRDINPGNTVGGPQTNSNGYVAFAGNVGEQGSYVPVPGYALTNGWDPCVGLGVIKGNTLVTALAGTPAPAKNYTLLKSINNTFMSYWGGNVLDNCQITVIFWGSGWQTANNPSDNDIVTAISTIIDAGYFTGLTEYGIFTSPTIVDGFTDLSSSASATIENFQPVFTNLIGHLTAGDLATPIIDNHLFLYVLSDTTGEAGSTYAALNYNNTIIQVAAVLTQASGINSWTPSCISSILEAILVGAWPNGWLGFTSNSNTDGTTTFANGAITEIQIDDWSLSGTSGGYAVNGYYSNLIRGVIIPGTA